MLTHHDREHVFQRLRDGLVPERGLDAYAVGIEDRREELERMLGLIDQGGGHTKFLRGGYGCGKTFMARLALQDAQRRGFATSFVVVSDNDLHFHKFNDVYRKVLAALSTETCPRGALGDILDRWIGKVEDALIDAGADEDASGFDASVAERMAEELASMTRGRAPEDMARVLQTIFELKQEGDLVEAGALLSWLSGSGNVAASAKRRAKIKGDIGSRDAMAYLRGVLEIVKAAGYRGLVIAIDEAETILRMRKDVRSKSLNGIRQICDDASSYPGLLWLFTGTPEFFDTRRGVAGLTPLNERIQFMQQGEFTSVKQAQLELRPFDERRLKEVARKLRDLYPARNAGRVQGRISDDFIDRLVASVTSGFKGEVGVIPRIFLREFVNHIDLVDEHEDYDPTVDGGVDAAFAESTVHDATMTSLAPAGAADEDDLIAVEDVW